MNVPNLLTLSRLAAIPVLMALLLVHFQNHDQLAEHRVIGGYQGSKSREVLMNLPDVDDLLDRLGIE